MENIKHLTCLIKQWTALERLLTDSIDTKVILIEGSEFLCWARQNPHVSIKTEEIPADLLPNGRRGFLHDLSVNCKYGPDDAIYDAHPDLRRRLARGNTILEVLDGPEQGVQVVCYALRKFTGANCTDDDDRVDNAKQSQSVITKDSGETWQLYFTQSVQTAKHVVFTRKQNGEACHFSCVSIEGQHYIMAGSKNTHLLFQKKNDISLYKSSRFRIARQMAEIVADQIESLSVEKRTLLFELLSRAKLNMVFEALFRDHQHVEDLSCLEKPALTFITWTSLRLDENSLDSLTALAPDDGMKLAAYFGFTCTAWKVVPLARVKYYCDKVHFARGYEGSVLYYVDCTGRVIGLVKKKTAWYVLCRALREKNKMALGLVDKKRSMDCVSLAIRKWQSRLNEIAVWLSLPEDVCNRWKELGARFIQHCAHRFLDNLLTREAAANMFPVLWKTFLQDEKKSDDVYIIQDAPGCENLVLDDT